MASIRNAKNEVVSGRGSGLTVMQEEFIERVRTEGVEQQGKIAKELNYTSYYRDKNNYGTAFYLALRSVVNKTEEKVEATKGMNLELLIKIRDEAMALGDAKMAMEAMKMINDMQGFKAPVKVQQTKIDVKATIDLTQTTEDVSGFIDIDYEDED
jgi:hypothetical protein